MSTRSRLAWRAWTLGEDADGPVLVSPYMSKMIFMCSQVAAPTSTMRARCTFCDDPPGEDCECGIYAMTIKANLAMWCYPADVVTKVRLHGRVLPGTGIILRGSFPGEVRATGARLVSPCYIAPPLAPHAPALEARYGVTFTPNASLEPGYIENMADAMVARGRDFMAQAISLMAGWS